LRAVRWSSDSWPGQPRLRVEHLEAISKTRDRYSAWITTAVKPARDTEQTPLDLRSPMILVEDKQKDVKQDKDLSKMISSAR
jgi:hypothetical protein